MQADNECQVKHSPRMDPLKNSVSRLILSWPVAHTAPGLEARYMLWPRSHTLQMCTGDAGTWGTAPAMPLDCPAAEQLSDKPVCQPSSASAPRLHKFILLKQYVYIYTTQTFYEETFSWCLYHTFAHTWGYKLLFLYCLLSGLHLSISAYKRRKKRKQARKKKRTFWSRNSSNIENSEGRWRKLPQHSF